MSPAHLVWFLATALITIAVLTVCTLASAGILTRRRPSERTPDAAAPHDTPERRAAEPEGRRAA